MFSITLTDILERYLLRGDMVKFAKFEATREEEREMLRRTFRLIEISHRTTFSIGRAVAVGR